MEDMISRKMAIDAVRELYIQSPKISNDIVYDTAIDQAHDVLVSIPSAQPEQQNARIFQGIIVEYPSISTYPEYEGKPYFSIKYTENEQDFIGYGTYKPDVLSEYLKKYFMSSAQPDSKETSSTHKALDTISRQAAIDAVMEFMPSLTTPDGCGQFDREIFEAQEMFVDIGQALNELPSAQPETHEERTETHACDCIERQAVYNVLDKMPVRGFKKDGETIHGLISLSQVNSAIINLPSAQSEPKWIPVSERLPEEYGEYRITWTTSCSKKRFIGDAEYEIITYEWDAEQDRFKGEWILEDYIKYYPDVKVIAWKPLEEPYKGEGD